MAHCGLPTRHRLLHRLLLTVIFTLALGACGGGSSDPGFIPGDGDSSIAPPSVTVELTLTNSDGEATTNVTSIDPGRLDILVEDSVTGPVSDVVVSASTNLGTLEPASGSALTDNEGKATLFLQGGTVLGAGTVTVTVSVEGDPFTASLNFQVGEAGLQLGKIEDGVFIPGEIKPGAVNLPAAGSTTLEVAVVDDEGDLVTSGVEVSFASGCANLTPPTAQISATATTVNGVATATYTAAGCVGDDVVNAVILGSTSDTANVTLTIASSDVNSILFVGVVDDITTLVLRGTGGFERSETATIQFEVRDDTNSPAKGVNVDFSLSTTIGDLSLTNASAITNEEGIATAIVQAGNVATSVRVSATIEVDGIDLTTVSDKLVVSTGLPDQNSFSLAFSRHNVPGGNRDGETTEATVRMADKFNNPVPDGTTVLFTTEYGSIQSSCETKGGDGVCETVTWSSQEPRTPLSGSDLITTIDNTVCPTSGQLGFPCPDDLGGVAGGRSTVLATAVGEESFVDVNGNGIYDFVDQNGDGVFDPDLETLEPFADLPEAFLDINENGVYDGAANCDVDGAPDDVICLQGSEETFVDFNENGLYDPANGIYNGTLCPLDLAASGDCTRELVNVRSYQVLVLSQTGGGQPGGAGQRLVLLDAGGNVVDTSIPIKIVSDVSYFIFAADQNNNPPTEGATLSVSSASCTIVSNQSVEVPNTNFTVAYGMEVKIQEDEANLEDIKGSLTVTLDNPVGGDPSDLVFDCIDVKN